MDNQQQWEEIVNGLVEGDDQVAYEFWNRYGARLHRLAENRLPGALQRRVGADDVVQSACRTFLRRARKGEFDLPDGDALWRLLCAITLAKLRKHIRFHLRQKRGLNQELHIDALSSSGKADLPPLAAGGVGPEAAAIFSDEFRSLLDGLDEEERTLVIYKLQRYNNEEIAEKMGCSERTVRRIVKRVQARLQRTLEFTVAGRSPQHSN